MTQQEFADLVGESVTTIDKLERDEDAWETIGSETKDKIYSQYSSMASYQPGKEERKEVLGEKKEKKSEKKRGVNCNKLLSKRIELGLTQKQLGELIGIHFTTILKLENDETAWATIMPATADKIMKFFESTVSKEEPTEKTKLKSERKTFGNWSDGLIVGEDGSVEVDEKYMEAKAEKEKKSDLVKIVEDPKALLPIPELKIKNLIDSSNNLTDKDRQIMKYVEFACGQLKDSKSHEDFETNIDILTRIIKKQY